MNGRQTIGKIMEAKEVTVTEMAKKLGISVSLMSARVLKEGKNDIPANILAETLDALDYDLVAMPRWRKSKEGYIIGD